MVWLGERRAAGRPGGESMRAMTSVGERPDFVCALERRFLPYCLTK